MREISAKHDDDSRSGGGGGGSSASAVFLAIGGALKGWDERFLFLDNLKKRLTLKQS